MPLDFTDSEGYSNIMASCGHRVREKGISLKTKIAMCIWCEFFLKNIKRPIPALYPDRVPESYKLNYTIQKGVDGKEYKVIW